MNTLGTIFLDSAINRLLTYKALGEKTFDQLEEKDFHYSPNAESNSIAVIIRHLHGNMLSRWTNFLTEDAGERQAGTGIRNSPSQMSAKRLHLLALWEEGWSCLLDSLRSLNDGDLLKTDLYPSRAADRHRRHKPPAGPLPPSHLSARSSISAR